MGFGLGFGVWGLSFGVWGVGFGVCGCGIWFGCWGWDLWVGFWGMASRIRDLRDRGLVLDSKGWGGGVQEFRRIISRLEFMAGGLWALRLRVQRLGLVASSLGFRPLGAAFRDALPFEPAFVFVFGAGLWRPVFVFGFSVFGVGCLAFPVKLGSGFGAEGLGLRVYACGI